MVHGGAAARTGGQLSRWGFANQRDRLVGGGLRYMTLRLRVFNPTPDLQLHVRDGVVIVAGQCPHRNFICHAMQIGATQGGRREAVQGNVCDIPVSWIEILGGKVRLPPTPLFVQRLAC